MVINPQHVMLLHHLRAFLEAAAAEGIPAAPLKGAHLITSVYPEGEDRGLMCDVDVLVRPADFDAAAALLGRMGYQRRHLSRRRRTDADFYEAGFALPLPAGRRVFLELHRQLVQPSRHPVDYDALWARAVASELDGAPCFRLSVEDHLLHAAVHEFTDRFVDPARSLRDADLLISHGGADLDMAARRARRWSCRRALWLLLSLLAEQRPHLALPLDALTPAAPVALALRALVPDARGLRFPRLGRRGGQALVWPLLFDGVRPLAAFAAGYARLRLGDAVEGLRSWAPGQGRGL